MAVSTKVAVRDALAETLKEAIRKREQRQEYVDTGTGREVGWVAYERQVMLDAVNQYRAEAGLPEVELAAIEADRLGRLRARRLAREVHAEVRRAGRRRGRSWLRRLAVG